MIASVTSRSRTAEHVPRRSSTGHAGARPHARPALHSTPCTSPKRIISAAPSKPISRSSTHNHLISAPARHPAACIATIKSP